MDDVYKVIFQCYLECIKKGFNRLGEALHQQAQMFVNMDKLLVDDCHLRIKEYQFCKEFNCPPYPSLKETPANVVDEFMIIQEEITNSNNRD